MGKYYMGDLYYAVVFGFAGIVVISAIIATILILIYSKKYCEGDS